MWRSEKFLLTQVEEHQRIFSDANFGDKWKSVIEVVHTKRSEEGLLPQWQGIISSSIQQGTGV